jgi:hypothetical protein
MNLEASGRRDSDPGPLIFFSSVKKRLTGFRSSGEAVIKIARKTISNDSATKMADFAGAIKLSEGKEH